MYWQIVLITLVGSNRFRFIWSRLYLLHKKTLKPKSHKHNETLVRSLNHYTAENVKETLEKIHFPDYLQYTCVNVAYSVRVSGERKDFQKVPLRIVTDLITYLKITMLIYLKIKTTNSSYWTYPKMLLKILSGFNTNKSAGMDQIPSKFLKEAADVLAYPLA